MTGLRQFDPDMETLARTWRGEVCTSVKWQPEGAPGGLGGICAGYLVKNGTTLAYAKPSSPHDRKLGATYVNNPIAAHEKIAADLAHDLRLPVPPAVLWDRGQPKDKGVRHCVISAAPFWPAYTWAQVMRLPKAGARLLPLLAKAASAISVFDTWLDNRDRVNGGNMIVHESDGFGLQIAYIDFAQSMSFGWGNGPAPGIVRAEGRYPGAAPLDVDAIRDTVSAIETMPEDQIRSIVGRVPGAFLAPERARCVEEGLLRRRECLRGEMDKRMGL